MQTAKKRTRLTPGTKIASGLLLSLGILLLSWGSWIRFSGFGTRPAGIEYLMIAGGAFFAIVGIIIILTAVLMSFLKEKSLRKDTNPLSDGRKSESNCLNRKKAKEMVLCALLVLSVLEIKAVYASSPTEWTQNSTFVRSGYQWDRIVYKWEWSLGPWPLPNGDNTYEVSWDYDSDHARWPEDGVIDLAATDTPKDYYGTSARVTYGPFVGNYTYDDPPPELSVDGIETLTLKGVVSDYGSNNYLPEYWTGIKFDAWFEDPLDSGRKMVIEMYFHGTGIQGLWVLNTIAP